ncbi:transcriptional regulator GlxA family with amidase domain [Chitinivorax tropicus]|uniref:Transcriptional regulator GlxA family with amidase domain n=1 Tax=Chitinivorax tropicus TaxID=714531 RepID=A0A840MPK8_9PROT|nr:helix-turn-helix domain-containing protein [Chitinivorax tropicus]MBB5018113.1 transcriptional regulator GlxA family with amidase domain [Chitinivorax tropicus]
MTPRHLYFILTPRFALLDFAGPAEAFRIANGFGARFVTHIAAPVVSLQCSIGLRHDGLSPLPEPLSCENSLVILTGTTCSAIDYQQPEAQQVVDWLKRVVTPEHCLATVCSATQLAARAGLLDGRVCTTHHSVVDRLRMLAPTAKVLEDRVFVEDGPIATAAGITAGIDLALYLIERHAGAAIAQQTAREMVVYMRRSGQDPQLSPYLAHRNHLHPVIHKAQDLISQDPAHPWQLESLAKAVNVSARNLTRLFKEHTGVTVNDYQLSIRLAHARSLLESTRQPIERVAELAGFGSARDFRRAWSRLHPESPLMYRRSLDGAK